MLHDYMSAQHARSTYMINDLTSLNQLDQKYSFEMLKKQYSFERGLVRLPSASLSVIETQGQQSTIT
jgi:hypothetical protein